MINRSGNSITRGFGLIDVSLGIIAGIGILVGSVILFQQISNTTTVATVSQATFNISSQIRSNSRNLDQVSDLPGVEQGGIFLLDLTGYALGPDIAQQISAFVDPASPGVFFLRVDELRPQICSRLTIGRAGLGANVVSADCILENPTDSVEHMIISFAR